MATRNTNYGINELKKLLDLSVCKRIFFCGIGGINMSSLASFSLKKGYKVCGSDRTESELTKDLRKKGADIFIGHDKLNVKDCDAFVYTVAISEDNEEYIEAGKMGIPRISRADFLGYIMTLKESRIGICGTHGKSTCTSMCESLFSKAGKSPVVMCGSVLSDVNSPYLEGNGDDFIFESCEYMDSFLHFNPTICVVLNIEMDHVDYFENLDRMIESYEKFVQIPEKDRGIIIYNADDENCVKAVKNAECKKISFGIENKSCDFSAENLQSERGRFSFDLCEKGEFRKRISLSVMGRHNIYNALGAICIALVRNISYDDCYRGILSYKGTKRRLEYKGRLNGCDFYDDYAHHPTEIKATLKALRELCKNNRLICVFQSHTYSRTKALLGDIAEALSIADEILVAPIYKARETDNLGMSEDVIAKQIGEKAKGYESIEKIAGVLKEKAGENDLCVIMGAGNINSLFDILKLENIG